MKKLKITFHQKSFYASLLEKEAPNTIAAIEAICPFKSRVSYAKLADREFFFQTPAFYDLVENPTYSQAGDVAFYGSRQCICIFYDNLTPLGFVNQFASIEPADLGRLRTEADTIWEKQGDIIQIEVIDQ
ncbi:MAG: DUF3830 family protein [Bacillota bacterium]|nr:DUF3830 family protein [Bacillota bacterium]